MFNQFTSTLSNIGLKTKALIGDFTNKVASAVSNDVNRITSGGGLLPGYTQSQKNTITNVQRFIEGKKNINLGSNLTPITATSPLPRFKIQQQDTLPSKIGKFAANIPLDLANTVVGKGVIAPSLDVGENIGRTITGRGLLPYEEARSGATRLGYQGSNVLMPGSAPESTKYGAKQVLGNVADVAEAPFAAYFGSGIPGFAKGFFEQGVKGAVKKSVLEGAINGGFGGFIAGLSSGRDIKDNFKYLTNLGVNTGGGATAGALFAGTMAGMGSAFKKLRDVVSSKIQGINPALNEQEVVSTADKFIRDELGRFTKQANVKENEPVFYGDLRENLGLPRNGDYRIPMGMSTKEISPTERANLHVNQSENINPSGITETPQSNITGQVEQGVSDAVSKVRTAIQEATTVRPQLESEISVARSQRAAKVAEILDKNPTEAGFKMALSQLKGPLAENQSRFKGIRNKLTQGDIDNMAKQVFDSPKLNTLEKISAWDGFNKLLTGEIPEPAQLLKLQDVFGQDLVKDVLTKRAEGISLKGLVMEGINIPRALITSADMSAPLRQSVIFTLSLTKLPITSKSFVNMFRDAFSPSSYQAFFDELPKRPLYNVMKDSGLYIANPNTAHLVQKEENFMTNYGKQIPVIGPLLDKTLGKVIRFSERAYTSYLNNMRVGVFESIANKFIKDGVNPETEAGAFKSLANFVNAGTGRGGLGPLEKKAAELNSVFFSPRLMSSRISFMNPVWYAKQDPRVRTEAIKSFAEFIGTGATILGLVKLAGGKNVKVESDPRSSDWGKIRIGHTTWDVWGGFQQWARFLTQMATGQRKSVSTGKISNLGGIHDLFIPNRKKEFGGDTQLSLALRFGRGKLNPIPGLVAEAFDGQKLYGGDINVDEEAITNTIPLWIQDTAKAFQDIGPEAMFTVGLPAFFGVGTQTFVPTPKKSTSKKKSIKAKAGF